MVWTATRYLWQWKVTGEKDEVWKLIADGSRLRYAFGLTAGTAELTLTKRKKAKQPPLLCQLFLNSPDSTNFDWVGRDEFTFHMKWNSGLFSTLELETKLEEEGEETLIRHTLRIAPHNILGKAVIPLLVGKVIRNNLGKTYEHIERFIENNGDTVALASFSPLSDKGLERLDLAGKELVAEGFRASWVKPLMQIVSLDSDNHLKNILPFELAEKLGVPRKRVVELFFAATKKGILDMQWQLRCPKCLKSNVVKSSLSELNAKGHCPKCDVHFHNNFARNIEVSFTPTKEVREIHPKAEPDRGPASNRTAFLKQTLGPHEVRVVDCLIPAGKYRIRTELSAPDQWNTLEFEKMGRGELSIEVGKEKLKVHFSGKEELSGIRVGNRTDQEQTVWIENLSYKTQALTGSRATTFQQFRTLFPKEVMEPAQVVGTDAITFLRAEIVDSGTVFRKKGSNPSYLLLKEFESFLEQIIDHHDGAIVRSNADGILAAFLEPSKGAVAALTINQDFDTFNATLPETERLTIRLAVHRGECVSTNLNNHLDYFGDSVNFVNSLPKECREREVVISSELHEDEQVKKVLRSDTLEVREEEAQIPEFSEPFKLLRVTGRLPD